MRRTRELLHQTETVKLELLNTQINRLGLRIKGSFYETAIPQVLTELRLAGVGKLEPVFYVSTGYGCIAGQPIISLGFYDFHPLIKELNYEIRGFDYSESEMVSLLRHEIGHAFCYCYKLYRNPEFRSLFEVDGHFFNTYPEGDIYDYNPWSKRYVNPAGDHYAQKHPDEDFAESFCVWLTPRSGWKKKYRKRSAVLEKLTYIDRVVGELGKQPPVVETDAGWMLEKVEDVKQTVGEFLGASPYILKQYYELATGYIDPDLLAMFRQEPRGLPHSQQLRDFARAEAFIRTHKQALINRISYWVGVDNFVVQDLLEKMIQRARILDLWLERATSEKKLIELTTYVATLCANYKNSAIYLKS